MAELKKITLFLDEILEIRKFDDNFWNGLQIEGRDAVEKIAFCVNPGIGPFKKAKAWGADMIIAHHGIFSRKDNPSIRGWLKERIVFLLKNEISFYVAHLPLDAHPKYGNNARIMDILGAETKESMGFHKGEYVGWIGECRPTPISEIVKKLKLSLGAKCVVLKYGKEKIKRIAVVSGGAPYDVFEAIEKNADLYITGDPSDILDVVKDAGINVIFAGHYATETPGVKALSGLLKKKFKVQTRFIDAPTGL